ncbi:hypothetical protein [Pseudazoarcus pumilus]|uniref:DUF4398 domain-containing protein n=1 Tax=Pseudazoarcus pumilus TaxID=2067960 RepID=A0A2I6S4H2_9RHOO|nr:hypothetical protein [Pseudazoarcus pumilus]AUN94160.1 hypothetical protein C0099_03910 [Pseudazoarcus pumilus]
MKLARLTLPALAIVLASGCASVADVEALKMDVEELRTATAANAKSASAANDKAAAAAKEASRASQTALNADQLSKAAIGNAEAAEKAAAAAAAAAKEAEVISYDAQSVSYKLRSDLVDRSVIPGETEKAAGGSQ